MDADRDESVPRRLTRAETKARTRALLLDAAARTFARKGFTGASVEEIAEAAGFSTGALYSNFHSKEALFLELLSDRRRDRLAVAAQALDSHEVGSGAVVGELGRLLVDVADKDIEFAALQAEFWLYAIRNPQVLDTMAASMSESRQALQTLVGAALARHGAPPGVPTESVATVVGALFLGLVRQRRIDPECVPEDLFGQALTWLFAGIKAEGTPATTDGE